MTRVVLYCCKLLLFIVAREMILMYDLSETPYTQKYRNIHVSVLSIKICTEGRIFLFREINFIFTRYQHDLLAYSLVSNYFHLKHVFATFTFVEIFALS